MSKKKTRARPDRSATLPTPSLSDSHEAVNPWDRIKRTTHELMNLPPDQQKLITWLSRRKQATFREITDALGQDNTGITQTLDALRASNDIYQALTDGEIYYRVVRRGTVRQQSHGLSRALRSRIELDQVTFLKQLSLFQNLSDAQLQVIADSLEERQYTRDEVILWQGDISEQIYFIKSGVVGITRFSAQDKAEKILRYMKPGDILGEYSTLLKQGGAATSTARALSAVTMLAMKKPVFLELLRQYPSIAIELASMLVGRLLSSEARTMSAAGTRLCLVVGIGAAPGVTTVGNTLALTLAHVTQKGTVYTEQPGTDRLPTLLHIPAHAETYRHPAGYDVVVPSEPAGLSTMLNTTLIFDRLVNHYSNIVIGVPVQAEDIVNYLAERADQIILITTPDPGNWLALNQLNARLHTLVHPEKVGVFTAINRPGPEYAACRAPGRVDFDLPFLGRLPSLRQQTIDRQPESMASMMSLLAGRLGRTNQIGIYIPTTIDVDQAVDTSAYVERTLAFLGQRLGGATTNKARGVWNSAEAGLVGEEIHIVRSYATQADLDRFLQEILSYVEGLKQELKQEAMAVEINQKLVLI